MSVKRPSDLILISSEGLDLAEFNPEKSIDKWMANGWRKIAWGPRQCDWPANIESVGFLILKYLFFQGSTETEEGYFRYSDW